MCVNLLQTSGQLLSKVALCGWRSPESSKIKPRSLACCCLGAVCPAGLQGAAQDGASVPPAQADARQSTSSHRCSRLAAAPSGGAPAPEVPAALTRQPPAQTRTTPQHLARQALSPRPGACTHRLAASTASGCAAPPRPLDSPARPAGACRAVGRAGREVSGRSAGGAGGGAGGSDSGASDGAFAHPPRRPRGRGGDVGRHQGATAPPAPCRGAPPPTRRRAGRRRAAQVGDELVSVNGFEMIAAPGGPGSLHHLLLGAASPDPRAAARAPRRSSSQRRVARGAGAAGSTVEVGVRSQGAPHMTLVTLVRGPTLDQPGALRRGGAGRGGPLSSLGEGGSLTRRAAAGPVASGAGDPRGAGRAGAPDVSFTPRRGELDPPGPARARAPWSHPRAAWGPGWSPRPPASWGAAPPPPPVAPGSGKQRRGAGAERSATPRRAARR